MTATIHRMRKGALLVSLALLLGACSDNDDRKHAVAPPPPPTGTVPPPPVADSFFSLVAARVASLLDNDEPVAVDAATATTPDNTEPEPVPST
ncbi:hypothetical protein [Massilia sp. BSC265]|uniref:hypothetical protein n=1 Tax=Massilia sp. BSC265 TaxID=1549812 RepID=UPI0004E8A675|nr:hypothetical protein [Massilia sp. BSC265]KFI08966.1 hypothetical protein JN27_02150 [Massilia sp. BSC265]